MAKARCNTADHHCLTADNHSEGCNLPQLAFKVCVNRTYYVRQADCLCSTNLLGFTAISKAQYGAQLDLESLNCLCLPTVFCMCLCWHHSVVYFLKSISLVIRHVPNTNLHPLILSMLWYIGCDGTDGFFSHHGNSTTQPIVFFSDHTIHRITMETKSDVFALEAT